MCMYVSEICADGFFVPLPSRGLRRGQKWGSKIALFANERHFEI